MSTQERSKALKIIQNSSQFASRPRHKERIRDPYTGASGSRVLCEPPRNKHGFGYLPYTWWPHIKKHLSIHFHWIKEIFLTTSSGTFDLHRVLSAKPGDMSPANAAQLSSTEHTCSHSRPTNLSTKHANAGSSVGNKEDCLSKGTSLCQDRPFAPLFLAMLVLLGVTACLPNAEGKILGFPQISLKRFPIVIIESYDLSLAVNSHNPPLVWFVVVSHEWRRIYEKLNENNLKYVLQSPLWLGFISIGTRFYLWLDNPFVRQRDNPVQPISILNFLDRRTPDANTGHSC